MSREAVVEAATEATDVIFDTVEAVPEVVKNNPFVIAAVALTSAVIASGVSIFITRQILKTKYERLIAEEMQEAKAFYSKRYKEGEFADPVTLAKGIADESRVDEVRADLEMIQAAADLAETQEYISYDKGGKMAGSVVVNVNPADVPFVTIQNVFEVHGEDDEFDHDAELDKKSAGKPYILEVDQFLENEEEYTQVTLTWYEGDNVLVDDREQPVRNHVGIIGEDNLQFGYGSKDPNVVYIRNDRFKADYEVIRSEEKYAEAIHGFIEPKDRRVKQPRRFRNEED